MYYIYKTTNKVNGKIYIGKTKHNNPDYLGSGWILHNAIKKYGKYSFIKEIIEECDDHLADQREIYYIEYYKSCHRDIGYNIAKGGTGGDTTSMNPNKDEIVRRRGNSLKEWHQTLSSEERKKVNANISKSKKGKSNGREGYAHTEDTIKKMRIAANSRNLPDTWKAAHLDAMAKRRGIPLVKKNKKVVVNGIEYESVGKACESLGLKYRKYFYDGIKTGKLKVEYK